jgi:hypothetical protein
MTPNVHQECGVREAWGLVSTSYASVSTSNLSTALIVHRSETNVYIGMSKRSKDVDRSLRRR